MNKQQIIPAVVLTVIGASIMATASYAQTSESGRDTMVQKLAAKLGIEETHVQTAFEQIRTERQQEMQAQFEERLNKAVSEGKITGAQKALILQKHEEMKSQRETDRDQVKGKTREERKAFMESRREEMKSWADANGIDLSLIGGPQGGPNGGRGMRGMMEN